MFSAMPTKSAMKGMDITCGCMSPSRKLKKGNSWIVLSMKWTPSKVLMTRLAWNHHQKSGGVQLCGGMSMGPGRSLMRIQS